MNILRHYNTFRHVLTVCLLAALLAACASKKNLNQGTLDNNATATGTEMPMEKRNNVVRDVIAQSVYARNIVAKMKFSVSMDGRNVSLDGKLQMRRDQVIRLQLAPLGLVEVARIEFTPDEVLFMDRVHKEYVREKYSRVSFLQRNGLDFYSLQALFWNQLFVPGEKQVGEMQIDHFKAFDANPRVLSLARGPLKLSWYTQKGSSAEGRILKTEALYDDNSHSQLSWQYNEFKALGQRQFPTQHQIDVKTNATKKEKHATVSLRLDKMSMDDSWEAETKVSQKYKKVELDDLLKQIL